MLLPVEIENAKFSRSVGGYTPAEVDEFLDYIKSKCAENADAEARLAVSVNEVKVLGDRIAELEAQVEAITAERDELKVKNDELKNALAEAAAQAASKAAEALPVNNVAADPVWDPDADEEIPEPFRVEGDGDGGDGGDGEAEIDEPESDGDADVADVADGAVEVETALESEDNDQDIAAEAGTEQFGDLENIFSHLDDIGKVENGQADAAEIADADDINIDTDIDIDVDVDGTDTISTARSDEDIAATLEAVLASLDIKPHNAPKTNVRDVNAYEGIDVSLDFDELESSEEDSVGAAGTDDNEGADAFEFSFDTADDADAANVEDTKDAADAVYAVDAIDGIETVEAIETIDSVDDVNDTDSADNVPAPQTQYARRVYRMRLKRAAKRHDEDQAILDALRAAYDDDDDEDDDLTQHEYDQYHYTFDSGKK